MRPHLELRRGMLGVSITEMTVATACVLCVFAAAIPGFVAVTRAGDEGQARTTADGDNRQALLRIAREVMNSSLETDAAGTRAYFNVTTGEPAVVLTDLDGPAGGTAPTRPIVTDFAVGDADSGTEATNATLTAGNSGGSGKLGGTFTGRSRATGSADYIGSDATRPRNRTATNNSLLVFRRVMGYTVGTGGEFTLNWTTPIYYFVRGRSLIRAQDGVERVVSANCSQFLVETTDSGTVVVTLGTQRRASSTGRVAGQSNQIEIQPKN